MQNWNQDPTRRPEEPPEPSDEEWGIRLIVGATIIFLGLRFAGIL